VKELAAIQKQLLANVAGSLKPGGKLIYSVCTLTKSETVDVVAEFEKQFPEFKPLPVSNPLAPSAPASPQVWLLPQDTGGNGMFIAAWRRA
jgi:16S rRNA (cytosine967-C5)-methyltransferase